MQPLFESFPEPLLMSGVGPLTRCGTHQTISGRLEQVYLPSDPRLQWPGEGPLFKLNLSKFWGQNVGTIRVTPGPLFMSGLGPLAREGGATCQILGRYVPRQNQKVDP